MFDKRNQDENKMIQTFVSGVKSPSSTANTGFSDKREAETKSLSVLENAIVIGGGGSRKARSIYLPLDKLVEEMQQAGIDEQEIDEAISELLSRQDD